MGLWDRIKSLFITRRQVSLRDFLPDNFKVPFPSSQPEQSAVGISRASIPDKFVKNRGLSYFVMEGNRDWVEPQYDHFELEVLCDVESYIRRATTVKLSLFTKEGFDFISQNDIRVKYIQARIKQIERASGIPFDMLLHQTCRDLLIHSNAFWLKIRKKESSGGRIRTVNGVSVDPVAAYFPLPPETMVPETDAAGNVLRWKHRIDVSEKIFSTRDIVHFYTNRKAGYPLGVPSLVSVKDDIRALRDIEANIDILIHKYLFPMVVWKLGDDNHNPAQVVSNGLTEIENMQAKIDELPPEGSFVVPYWYDIEAVGIENKALRVDPYLMHFRDRVFAGLDVSSIDMSVGNASSRSTAQTLSRNVIDIVKLQQIIIERFAEAPLTELLLESTFDQKSILAPENLVQLKFREIDKEAKNAKENHALDMMLKNGLNYPEYRLEIGKEPLTPEEEKELHFHKFEIPLALVQSVDEDSGLGKKRVTPSSGSVSNKNTPTNQHGSRPSTKLNKDSFQTALNPDVNPIARWHDVLRDELQARWVRDGELDKALTTVDVDRTYTQAHEDFSDFLKMIIRMNLFDPERVTSLSSQMESRSLRYTRKLKNEILRRLLDKKEEPVIVFDSLRYRTALIYDTEKNRAANLSVFESARFDGVDVEVVSNEDACEICRSKLTLITPSDKLVNEIPPFHVLCQCKLRRVQQEG